MVLNWQAPTMIKGILKALSNMLSLVDVMASAKCLGVDTFHDKWRLHCLFIPVVMMLIPLGLWLKDEGRAEPPRPALASLTSRSFFVVFFCYPRICKFTFDVFIVHVRPNGKQPARFGNDILYLLLGLIKAFL